MTKKESPFKRVLEIVATTIICALSLFVFSTKSLAQNNEEKSEILIVDPIETKPEFKGGIIEFYKFIGKNFKMPAEAGKNRIQGKIYMQFIVEENGSLSEIKILKDLGYGLGEEAKRVLRLSPKWIPGSQQGKAVRVLYSLPITIQAEK